MASIVPYQHGFATDFKDLNLAWLEEFFYVEEYDRKLLEDCEKSIIGKGGHIFFYRDNETTLGTAALLPVDDHTFELGKMAVDKSSRGLGIGQSLLSFCLSFSKLRGYKRIVLYSNTTLKNSLHIYRKYGFREVPMENDNPYERGDIKMEKLL